ncbi:MAG: hypothetical protein ACRDNF_24490 [Streptosporangiaceae bacterium]
MPPNRPLRSVSCSLGVLQRIRPAPRPGVDGLERWPEGRAQIGEPVGAGFGVTSLTHGGPHDPCWTDERERLLIEAADALHDSADLGDDLWHRLTRLFSDEQFLDLLMLTGWYHAISFTANGARVACEDGAPRFADVQR